MQRQSLLYVVQAELANIRGAIEAPLGVRTAAGEVSRTGDVDLRSEDVLCTAAGFVEIKLPQSEPGCPCVIEMRGRGGATMSVRLAVAELDRVAGLAEAARSRP